MGKLYDPRTRNLGKRYHGLGGAIPPQVVNPLAALSSSIAVTPGFGRGFAPSAALSTSTVPSVGILQSLPSAPIQQKTASSTALSATFSVVLDNTPGVGNTLILCQGGNDVTNMPISSLSQTGVTWTKAVGSNTNQEMEIWYGVVATSPSKTLNVTMTGAPATTCKVNLHEWPILNASPLNTQATNTGNSSTPASSSITPTAAKNMLLVGICRKGGTGTVSSPFVALSTTDTSFAPSYQVVSSTSGSYTANWTWTLSTTWDAVIAAFTV